MKRYAFEQGAGRLEEQYAARAGHILTVRLVAALAQAVAGWRTSRPDRLSPHCGVVVEGRNENSGKSPAKTPTRSRSSCCLPRGRRNREILRH